MLAGIIIIIFAGILFIDFIPNRKSRKRKEKIFYGIVLAVSFCILMLYCAGYTLPSPTEGIESVVKMIVPVK